ncbi:MAG: imidazole glycerol phosphate synthase subunit HisH [Thermodesulfobacteriota bacterium]|nr:imidazole glycerol phosphate synthase subunit HisH [Thermodesulfobacteriota bacterium]
MVAIIDYGAGNLTSVARALEHIGVTCKITDRYEEILSSERIIFPGVGAAGKAMEVIRHRNLDKAIHAVVARETPFLGICMGAQIILGESEENDTTCLNIIPGIARRFPDGDIKIPHMGWNDISVVRSHPVLEGLDGGAQFYFVHSYYPAPEKKENIIATTDYGVSFASIIGRDNVIATQFHLEKSGRHGLKILKNFCDWNGRV